MDAMRRESGLPLAERSPSPGRHGSLREQARFEQSCEGSEGLGVAAVPLKQEHTGQMGQQCQCPRGDVPQPQCGPRGGRHGEGWERWRESGGFEHMSDTALDLTGEEPLEARGWQPEGGSGGVPLGPQ